MLLDVLQYTVDLHHLLHIQLTKMDTDHHGDLLYSKTTLSTEWECTLL